MAGEADNGGAMFPRGGREPAAEKKKSRVPGSATKNKRERPVEKQSRDDAVTALTFKSLGVGMMLLGVVREIVGNSVVIALPSSLLGHTARENELLEVDGVQPLDKVLNIGQLVRVVISQLTKSASGRKRVVVSLDPDAVNVYLSRESITKGRHLYGVVRSVEDHGYAISFGKPHSDSSSSSHFGGFLLADLAGDRELLPGSPVECVVIDNVGSRKKIPRVIRVSARPDLVSSTVTSEYIGMSIENLQPGLLVNGRVEKIDDRGAGLIVTFLSFFRGSVGLFHLGKPLKSFNPGDAVSARILFIDPALKRIGLTLLPDIVQQFRPPAIHDGYENGAIFHDAVIQRIDVKVGLLLSRQESPSVLLYAHVSRISDQHIEDLRKHFKVGQTHSCRVVNHASMDGLVLVSMEESVVNRTLYSYDDVKVGQVLPVKVRSLQKYGCIVALEIDIQALIPTAHLADMKLRKPQAKFKEDAIIRVRVLSVDATNKRILVTARSSLVDSVLPLVSTLQEASNLLGRKVQGYIIGITDNLSLKVALGGQLQATVTEEHLDVQPSCKQDVESSFPIGRAVAVWLLGIGRNGKSLLATLRGEEAVNVSKESIASKEHPDLQLGSRVDIEVDQIREKDIVVKIISVNPPVQGFLLHNHLGDYLHLVPDELKKLKADPTTLTTAMVLSFGQAERINLTCKKSLLKAAKASHLPRSLTELSEMKPDESVVLAGYAKYKTSRGIVVGFLGDCTGYIRKSRIADSFIADPEERVRTGQSLTVAVESVDTSENRAMLTTRHSDLVQREPNLVAKRLRRLFKDRDEPERDHFSIGDLVEVTVDSEGPHGTVFRLDSDTLGVALQSQIPEKSSLAPGTKCIARILDIDESSGLFDLTLAPSLLKKPRTSAKDLSKGQSTRAVVQLVRDAYCVLSCPDFNNAIVFGNAKEVNADAVAPDLVQGMEVEVTVSDSKAASRTLVTVDLSSKKVTRKPTDAQGVGRQRDAVGCDVKGRITAVTPSQVNVAIRPGVVGRLHISETADTTTTTESPFSQFKVGEHLVAKVAAVEGAEETGFRLELTQRTLSPTVMGVDEFWTQLERPGFQVTGFVKAITESVMWLHLSPHLSGCISPLMMNASTEFLNSGDPFRSFEMQQRVSCRVVRTDRKKQRIDLATGDQQDGSDSVCRVAKILPGKGLSLALPRSRLGEEIHFGVVPVTEVSDNFGDTEDIMGGKSTLGVGSYVTAVVLSEENGHVDLSMRESRISCGNKGVVDKVVEKASDCVAGTKIRGFVRVSSSKGCFVNLGRNVVGRILVSDLSDGFVRDIEKTFPVDKLVSGYIKSSHQGQIDVTLRSPSDEISLFLESLKVGRKVKGVIKSIQPFGVFVGLGKGVVGLCHKSQVSDDKISDLNQRFSAGQKVEAVVTKVESTKKRVSLCMKRSLLISTVEEESSEADEPASSEDDTSMVEAESEDGAVAEVTALEIPGGFEFSDDDVGDVQPESDAENEEVGTKRKKSSKEKRAMKRQKAERARDVREKEDALVGAKDNPETAEDFERLIMGSPNSSITWIRYMAFYLSQSQISKAREIAQRALKTIFYREVAEKLNVWLAYVNLESIYGSSETSVMEVLREAAHQVNDKHLYLQAYESLKSKKPELATAIYDVVLKKHKSSKKVWLAGGLAQYEQGNLDEGRSLLMRAIGALPNRKHIAVQLKFAQFEYRHGSVEHGRTAFEGLIGNHAKRVDLWSVYLDMEIRALRLSAGAPNQVEFVRNLMRRCCTLDLSSKKMKFFFKRFLEFEQEFGNDDSIDVVKTLARQYVESKME